MTTGAHVHEVAQDSQLPVPGKLVRDRIPAIIEADDRTAVVSYVGGPVYDRALRDKLLEEAAELAATRTDEDLTGEAADVLDVLDTLLAVHGIDRETVEQVRADKRAARGGFDQGCWLHG